MRFPKRDRFWAPTAHSFSESSSHRKHMPWKIWLLYNNYDYSLSIIITTMNHYSCLTIIWYSYNNNKQSSSVFILHNSSSFFLSLHAAKLRIYLSSYSSPFSLVVYKTHNFKYWGRLIPWLPSWWLTWGGCIGSNLVTTRGWSRLNIVLSNMPTQACINNTNVIPHAIVVLHLTPFFINISEMAKRGCTLEWKMNACCGRKWFWQIEII